MELNKTQCLDCGHVNRWYSYKWASTPERQEHNRVNSTTCPSCKGKRVKNVEDDETMAPYRGVAQALFEGSVVVTKGCPKADPQSMLTEHLMKLAEQNGANEVWRCARDCGHMEIRPHPIDQRAREKQP